MKRPSKYRAIPTVVDGIRFASKKEAKRYAELKILGISKYVTNLTCQPRFPLIVNGQKIATYVGDFKYNTPAHQGLSFVIEDVKGMQTPAFKLKWKLVQALYPEYEWRLS